MLCEGLIEEVEVVVGAPVANAVDELRCEQITSRTAKARRSSYASHWLYSARTAATFSLRDPVEESAMLQACGACSD